MGIRATLVLMGVLAIVAAFIVIRDWRATEVQEDRLEHEFTCAMEADAGQLLDDDC